MVPRPQPASSGLVSPTPFSFCRRAELVSDAGWGQSGCPGNSAQSAASWLQALLSHLPTWPPGVCIGQGAGAQGWFGFLLSGIRE